MISVCASGCMTSCTTFPKLRHDVVARSQPWDGLDGPAAHVVSPLLQFLQPHRIELVIGGGFKAFEQVMRKLRAIGDRKREDFGEETLSSGHDHNIARGRLAENTHANR